MPLSSQNIQDKNALGTDAVFLVLLEINIPGTPTIYLTNNGDSVVWNSITWQAFPFEIAELTERGSGEVPQWSIQLDNRSRVIEKYLSDYDQYLKVNGIDGNEIICKLYVVNSKEADSAQLFDDVVSFDAISFMDNLTGVPNAQAIMEVSFELNSPTTTPEIATFNMTADSPFNLVVPKRRYIKQYCYWKFKGLECGYIGTGETCDKSLTQCRAYNNSARYGGFPGVGTGGIRL